MFQLPFTIGRLALQEENSEKDSRTSYTFLEKWRKHNCEKETQLFVLQYLHFLCFFDVHIINTLHRREELSRL
jgi:hypothetical protein